VEVIDPVTLSPLDMQTIAHSVAKTGRLLVVDTGWTSCGASAEIVARVAESGVNTSQVWRMGFAPTTCPPTPALEDLFYPNGRTIAQFINTKCIGVDPGWSPREEIFPEQVEFRGPF
jgi:pyruvate/2-oxoglutarate/acetoin dehydrogenase E1 component